IPARSNRVALHSSCDDAIPGCQNETRPRRWGKELCVGRLPVGAPEIDIHPAMLKARLYPESPPLLAIDCFKLFFDQTVDAMSFFPQFGESSEMFHPRFLARRMRLQLLVKSFGDQIAEGAS